MSTTDESILKNSLLPNSFRDPISLLSKNFVAGESLVIDITPFRLGNTLSALVLENENKQIAQFICKKNIVSKNATETWYFKEIINELGVTVAYNDGSATVTNGGVAQYLKAVFKG